MSVEGTNTQYSQLLGQFADRMNVSPAEADAWIATLQRSELSEDENALDHLELLLAVSLNAKLHNASDAAQFKKLKFLLRNNSARAVNLANLWVERKVSFDDMLAAV